MKLLRVGDPLVLIVVFVLFLIGVFVLYTTSPIGLQISEKWVDSYYIKQLIFGLLGILVIVILSSIDLQISKTLILQILAIVMILLLLGGLFVLGPLVNETHRWYQFGQFLFQPSEFAKIVLAFWTAYWLTNEGIKNFARLLLGGAGIVISLGLIVLQPDFGAMVIFLVIITAILALWASKFEDGRAFLLWFVLSAFIVLLAVNSTYWLLLFEIIPLFLILRSSWKLGVICVVLSGILVGGLLLGRAVWNTSAVPRYIRDRLESFTGAQEELMQIRQSKIAIGSGRVCGRGIAQGTQSRLRFLPEYRTDFIFAAFVEERGFGGMLLLFALYLLLFGRLIYLALQIKDEYSRLIVLGLTVKLWFETFWNIGVNMGVLPTKGVALPFMSYGGSSLLANSVIIGIILSMYRFEEKRDTISPSFGLA